MKRIGLIGLALCLMLGVAVAQRGRGHDHEQDHGRSAHAQEHRSAQQARDEQGEQREIWRQHRAADESVAVRTWSERGGYRGPHIDVSYYRVHYGPRHVFRVYREPFMVVEGAPRFQYAGYWFSVVEPVPAFWGPAWYETDNVYIVEHPDGYYLYNANFPSRPGIAISVVF